MTLTILLGWCLAALGVAYLWHVVRRSQPKRPKFALVPPPVEVTITLTQRQLANMQIAALLVSTGAEKAVALGCDYANSAGVGRLIVLVCDDATFVKAVEPAVRAHLEAGKA